MPKSYEQIKVPDAPDNSYASKSMQKVENTEVAHGKVVNHENSFFKGSVESAGHSILTEILIPAAKDTIYNMFSSFMSSLLFGNTDVPQRGANSRNPMHTADGRPYNDYSNPNRNPFYNRPMNQQRSVYEYGDIEFATRGDAELILGRMRDICDTQGFCTVFNYYEISGNRPNSTDNSYGWYELPESVVKIRKQFNGSYRIILPEPIAIRY